MLCVGTEKQFSDPGFFFDSDVNLVNISILGKLDYIFSREETANQQMGFARNAFFCNGSF